ncbi:MAG TPA: carbonic anhydrase family protein [Nakamurella sp.]
MSSRSTSRVRIGIAALGLTLLAAVAAPSAVAASTPPVTPPAPAWSHSPALTTGPQFWGSLDPGWAACANPDGQSPVVVTNPTVDKQLPALRADYLRTPLLVENTGHVVEVPQPDNGGGTLEIGKAPYQLQQWHIHAPAEHVVNGHRADLEIHLVHSDAQGHTVVVAVFTDIVAAQHGQGSAAAARLLRTVLRGAPDTPGEEADLHQRTSAAVLLGAGPALFGHNKVTLDKYLTYTGSLTTPPCTGGVGWYLLPKIVIAVDPKDVEALHELIAAFPGYEGYPDNNRPVQPLGDRTVTGTRS